jgi:hypothetical protein
MIQVLERAKEASTARRNLELFSLPVPKIKMDTTFSAVINAAYRGPWAIQGGHAFAKGQRMHRDLGE